MLKMRVFSSTHTFDYTWNEVSTANWRKYCPWNQSSMHVVAVDTLSCKLDRTTGVLVTERLLTCSQMAPAIVRTLLGGHCTTYSLERSFVDPNKKKVVMCSSNLTWKNLVSVRETVTYEPESSPSPSGPERTIFKQEARITALCGGWQKMRSRIEEATLERFRENAKRGREGFETVLEMSRVFSEEGRKKCESEVRI